MIMSRQLETLIKVSGILARKEKWFMSNVR